MNDPGNFAQRLKAIRQERCLSLTRFAEVLQVPRSTLQSILQCGQTSLDTACRVSNMLKIPLSALVDDGYAGPESEILVHLLHNLSWFICLPRGKQDVVIQKITQLLEVITDEKPELADIKLSRDDGHPESVA